nr:methyltransferase [Candidatus Krumholzibacteria bacterium]
LVLCNPPFHQDHTVGDATARALFAQAHGVLKSGGELRIVANRHLGYHARLTELFGGCALVAENDKFVILSARRGQ